jgi:hypothetical protein
MQSADAPTNVETTPKQPAKYQSRLNPQKSNLTENASATKLVN